MIDVMNVGTGANFTTRHSQKELKSYDTGYKLGHLVKDVKTAKDLIETSGFRTDLPALAEKYLDESQRAIGAEADHAASLEVWEQRADIQIKKTEGQEVVHAARNSGIEKPLIGTN